MAIERKNAVKNIRKKARVIASDVLSSSILMMLLSTL